MLVALLVNELADSLTSTGLYPALMKLCIASSNEYPLSRAFLIPADISFLMLLVSSPGIKPLRFAVYAHSYQAYTPFLQPALLPRLISLSLRVKGLHAQALLI